MTPPPVRLVLCGDAGSPVVRQALEGPEIAGRGFAVTEASADDALAPAALSADAVLLVADAGLTAERRHQAALLHVLGVPQMIMVAGDAATAVSFREFADRLGVTRPRCVATAAELRDLLAALEPAAEPAAEATDQVAAHLVWTAPEPMLPGRRYELVCAAGSVAAEVTELKYKLSTETLEHQAGKTLERGELAFCNLALEHALAFAPGSRTQGGFTLRDRFTGAPLAAGAVAFGLRRATNLSWQALDVDKAARARAKGQVPCVVWLTGLSGSGKSTVANLVERKLHAAGRHTYILDGDNVRHGLNKDLGFTDADRVENIRRIAEVARLFVDAGLIVITSFISPFRSERQMARELLGAGEFLEVFVDAPLAECERRDPKGLYRKARAGKIAHFTGIDSAYEPPAAPELVLRTAELSAEEAAERVVGLLRQGGHV